MKRTLGTCYYPEHWPEEIWATDANRMAELGLTWVRIGEFAWSRLEPAPGQFDWAWMDRAIDVLGGAGLKVVLGTPTATPPRWVLDKHPDMLAIDAEGKPRKFGSRRHYCFSHQGYLDECRRIVTAMAERYGAHPHVAAWQTDNEYGCHDTVYSYSEAARTAFQSWLRQRYQGHIGALNAAWGNVFWSMEYADFKEIDLPNLTVTEANPAHCLDYRRFSSDQVAQFNKVQVDILRQYSTAPVAHNYMGRYTEFDHFDVGADLEIASWDSYPLGFLMDRVGAPDAVQQRFAQQGDPDFQAFHHDLYRAVGRGRWWVMEQQPGPVNWAPVNPAPKPGMVRLWAWEAFAHGAEAVCYFRWRQAPFAQEQLHAGLLRPDHVEAPGFHEAAQVARELADAPDVAPAQAPVALMFDYAAEWAWEIQPQGQGLAYFDLVYAVYRALRRAGISVDIVSPKTRDFSGYKLVCAPGVMHMAPDLRAALSDLDCPLLLGPRSAARQETFTIPNPLPPNWPGLDITVSRLETIRADLPRMLKGGGSAIRYIEDLEGTAEAVLSTADGAKIAVAGRNVVYLGAWLDDAGFDRLIAMACAQADLPVLSLPDGLRCRDTATERFWINYAAEPVSSPDGEVPACSFIRVSR